MPSQTIASERVACYIEKEQNSGTIQNQIKTIWLCILTTQNLHKKFLKIEKSIVTGHKCFGGFIGSVDDVADWFEQKVKGWMKAIIKISNAASKMPHTMCIASTKSFPCEWIFLQRVVIDAGAFYSLTCNTGSFSSQPLWVNYR